MDILYLLIPMSVLLVFAIIGLFAWSLQAGQFEDLDREGERILQQEPQLNMRRHPGARRDPLDGNSPALTQSSVHAGMDPGVRRDDGLSGKTYR